MAEIILHHFDPSPFAEKARRALGMKALAWRSVQIPMLMPRPALMPLTGGYRKTPVLQIGADVYCDSRLIARELERRHPTPPFFHGNAGGLELAFSHWGDTAFFEPGAALAMAHARGLPDGVIEDRKQFFNFMDFDRLQDDIPHRLGQFRALAALLEEQLADGRAFLLGDTPGWTDITASFPLWMLRGFVPQAAPMLDRFGHVQAWESRMNAIGHGDRREMDAEEALDVAARAEPLPAAGVDADDPLGLRAGEQIIVSPDDYGRVPVAGELVGLDLQRITIRRSDPRTGMLHTHFPRTGYRIDRA